MQEPTWPRQSIEQILADYPQLDREEILGALEYAAAIAREREIRCPRPDKTARRRAPLGTHRRTPGWNWARPVHVTAVGLGSTDDELEDGAVASVTPGANPHPHAADLRALIHDRFHLTTTSTRSGAT